MSGILKTTDQVSKEDILNAKDKIFGIVVSEWNSEITDALLAGAIEGLESAQIPKNQIVIKYVPGTFELPFGAKKLIEKHNIDAVICLGCVIQGETKHFDFICQAAAHGIMDLGLSSGIPVIFGVLTTNDLQQAKERSGGKYGNKGTEAAVTALKLAAY